MYHLSDIKNYDDLLFSEDEENAAPPQPLPSSSANVVTNDKSLSSTASLSSSSSSSNLVDKNNAAKHSAASSNMAENPFGIDFTRHFKELGIDNYSNRFCSSREGTFKDIDYRKIMNRSVPIYNSSDENDDDDDDESKFDSATIQNRSSIVSSKSGASSSSNSALPSKSICAREEDKKAPQKVESMNRMEKNSKIIKPQKESLVKIEPKKEIEIIDLVSDDDDSLDGQIELIELLSDDSDEEFFAKSIFRTKSVSLSETDPGTMPIVASTAITTKPVITGSDDHKAISNDNNASKPYTANQCTAGSNALLSAKTKSVTNNNAIKRYLDSDDVHVHKCGPARCPAPPAPAPVPVPAPALAPSFAGPPLNASEANLPVSKRFRRNPRFSQTQFEMENILATKRALREKNLLKDAAAAAAAAAASCSAKTGKNLAATPVCSRKFGRAFSPTIYTPDLIAASSASTAVNAAEEINRHTAAEISQFLHIFLSAPILALRADYREKTIEQHIASMQTKSHEHKETIIPNETIATPAATNDSFGCQLPLTYESLEAYQAAYKPLIVYESWAQTVESLHANIYPRLPLSVRAIDLDDENHFITVSLRALVATSEVLLDLYALENWIVLLMIPAAAAAPPLAGNIKSLKGEFEQDEDNDNEDLPATPVAAISRSEARSPTAQTADKMAIGFVQSFKKGSETYPTPLYAPKSLPIIGGIVSSDDPHERNNQSLTTIQYVVKLHSNECTRRLIANRSTLVMQAVNYIRPTVRLIETLSLMHFKPCFVDTFLRPRSDISALDTTRSPKMKQLYGASTFNEQQRKAIFACFNSVQKPYSTSRVVMIQGPPGTGKTHTLVGIVQNLLINCSHSKAKPLRILICAPSNGAVDEIACRLIRDRHFLRPYADHKLRIVRIGQSAQVHTAVKTYLLENLINQNYEFCQRTRSKAELRDELLLNADVILSTLCSVQLACMSLFRIENVSSHRAIRCVIVDEASQCTEPELLMPLIYPISKLILVGDHQQLPATVISRAAFRLGYGRSIFERFVALRADSPVDRDRHLLSLCEQFRMHAEICRFPSAHFYGKRLRTPAGVGICRSIPALQPFRLFNIENANEKRNSAASKFNIEEADFIFKLLLAILRKIGYDMSEDQAATSMPKSLPCTIGVITFYRGQKQELIRRLGNFAGGVLLRHVDINTVDAFQGQERDIVILSCVRAFELTPSSGAIDSSTAASSTSIGFVRSQQRMNVALTRAKSALYVCIHSKSFATTPGWSELIRESFARQHFISITKDTSTAESLQRFISL